MDFFFFVFGLACGLAVGSSQWATEAISLGLKRPGREVAHVFLPVLRFMLDAPNTMPLKHHVRNFA
jgi:hypothetical protein